MFFIAPSLFGFLIVCTPLVSEVWLGKIVPVFLWSTLFLSIGWFINILSVPAYYACVGTGDLGMPVVSHIAMSVLNVSAGFLLGGTMGGIGVILAWSIAIGVGGLLLNILYFRKNGISKINIIPKGDRLLTAACITGLIVNYIIYLKIGCTAEPMISNIAIIICFISIISIPLWHHPIRKVVFRFLTNED